MFAVKREDDEQEKRQTMKVVTAHTNLVFETLVFLGKHFS